MIELVDSSRNLDSKVPILEDGPCPFLEECDLLVLREPFRSERQVTDIQRVHYEARGSRTSPNPPVEPERRNCLSLRLQLCSTCPLSTFIRRLPSTFGVQEYTGPGLYVYLIRFENTYT